MIMNGLKDKYSSFTYEDNSYTAKNLELNPMGTMNEVSLVFEDGVLKTLDFKIDNTEMKMTQHIEIGVADIEIPTDFTEKTA